MDKRKPTSGRREFTFGEIPKKLIASGLLSMIGATGVSACAPKGEVPAPAPSASEPSNPGEQTPTPTEATPSVSETPTPSAEVTKTREQLIAELEIEDGLSPKEYATEYLKRVDTQKLAGGSKEYYEEMWLDPTISTDDIVSRNKEIAAEQGELFREALYIPNWEDEPTLAKVIPQLENGNAVYLYQAGANAVQGGEFKVWSELVSAEVSSEESATERTYAVVGVEHNNVAEMPSDQVNAAVVDGLSFKLIISVIEVDGKTKITYLDSVPQ